MAELPTPPNERTRYTLERLHAVLLELLVKKDFEDITVTELCRRAGVHRTTFYRHFEDKYHLLKSALLSIQLQFDALYDANPFAYEQPRDYYFQIFYKELEFMAAHQDLFMRGIFNRNNQQVMEIFRESSVTYLAAHLQAHVEQDQIDFMVPIPIIAEYFAGAAVSIACWWLKNNMPLSIDAMVTHIITISSGQVARI